MLEVRGAGVVHVLGDGIGRPVAGILAQGQQLGFRVLIFIAGADAGIEGDVHGKSRPFCLSTYRQDANKNTTPRGCVSARSGVWQCWRSTHREYTTRRQGQMPVERKGYEDGSLGMSGTARLARSKCVTIQSFSVSPSAWAAACQVRGVITLRMGDSGIKVEVHFRHFAGNRSMARDMEYSKKPICQQIVHRFAINRLPIPKPGKVEPSCRTRFSRRATVIPAIPSRAMWLVDSFATRATHSPCEVVGTYVGGPTTAVEAAECEYAYATNTTSCTTATCSVPSAPCTSIY